MLIQDSSYSNTAKIDHINSKIMAINLSGFVPVELFNQIETPIGEEHIAPVSEPIFGANIKDAIRITKQWLSSRD